MNAIQYLLQVNLYLVLFYGFYRLLLKNETFHQNNRLFLLVGAGVSLLIPILQSDYVQDLFITDQVRETVLVYMLPMQFVAATTPEKSFTIGEILMGVYGLGALIMGFKFLKNLLNLRKLLLNGVLAFRAFTFGRKIYVDQSLPESQTIHAHEAVHAQQLHSFDVIFFEILLIINWFNPVLYAYRQAVKNIHEFLADEIASDELGKAAYARLLLSQEFGVSPHHFITSFFDQSTLKQRINMLAKPKSRKTALLKYGLSAPLFITMLIVSSSFVSKSEVVEAIPAVLENSLPKVDSTGKKIDKFNLDDLIVMDSMTNKITFAKDKNPLILLNGKLVSKSTLETLNMDKIAAIDINTTASEITNYGPSAKDGVIKVITQDNTKAKKSIPADGVTIKIEKANGDSFTQKDVDKMIKVSGTTMVDSNLKGNVPIILNADGSTAPNPLWVIDGKIVNSENFNLLPEIVVAMVALKGEVATKKYGEVGKNGVIEITTKPSNEFFTQPKPPKAQQQDPIFVTVEKTAEFPGGIRKLMQFLASEIKYPATAQRANVQGKVYLQFVVRKDGSINDIKILKGIGFGCDEEAIRVVKLMPKWSPAKQKGKAVSQMYTLPIQYALEEEEKK